MSPFSCLFLLLIVNIKIGIMNTDNLGVIAHNTWRILARNRIFQIYFLGAFAGIVFFSSDGAE